MSLVLLSTRGKSINLFLVADSPGGLPVSGSFSGRPKNVDRFCPAEIGVDRKPVRFQKVRQLVDTHAVDAWTSLVRPHLLKRSPHVAALAHLFHEALTKHWAFDGLSRWERIDPRSESPRLHLSFPVKGQLDWLAVFHIALKRQRLLATPDRSGLRCP